MLSAFKNFTITFLIAALIFGVGAYFATGFLEDTMDSILRPGQAAETLPLDPTVTDPPDTKDPDAPDPPMNVPTGSSFTMLIAITDYQPDLYDDYIPTEGYLQSVLYSDLAYSQFLKQYRHATASSMILLRADKEHQTFSITPLSSLIKLTTPAGDMRFGDTYGYFSAQDDPTGMKYIVSSVKALTGLDVNYYIKINVTELDDVMYQLGTVSVELPCSVYALEDGYSTLSPEENETVPLIKAGKFTAASDTVLPLYLLPEYSEQEVKNKMAILYTLSNAYFKEISDMTAKRINDLFSKLLSKKLIVTNMTAQDLDSEIDLIKMYSEYTVKEIEYPITCGTVPAGKTLDFTTPNIRKAVSEFDIFR